MPLTFPGHQGLILPVAHRWPNSFDAVALLVGAAMPDVSDSILGFLINRYFKQWYGHSLVGVFLFDIPIGLLLTWLVAILIVYLSKHKPTLSQNIHYDWRRKRKLWGFSVIVGIVSHLGFDLISHSTNLLLYPWSEDPRWFPAWWYTTWFEFRPPAMFGHSYAVGPFTVIWGILSFIGVFYFFHFLMGESNKHRINGGIAKTV
jgi:hypothetical protein